MTKKLNSQQVKFLRVKVERLEKLIQGGWLRHPEAQVMLVGFAETVKQGLKRLED